MLGAEIATACLFGRVAIFFCGLLLPLIRLWGVEQEEDEKWRKKNTQNGSFLLFSVAKMRKNEK